MCIATLTSPKKSTCILLFLLPVPDWNTSLTQPVDEQDDSPQPIAAQSVMVGFYTNLSINLLKYTFL